MSNYINTEQLGFNYAPMSYYSIICFEHKAPPKKYIYIYIAVGPNIQFDQNFYILMTDAFHVLLKPSPARWYFNGFVLQWDKKLAPVCVKFHGTIGVKRVIVFKDYIVLSFSLWQNHAALHAQ